MSTGRYSTEAFIALVLGVASLLLLLPGGLLALPGAVAAVILDHLAIREVAASRGRGREIAIGGLFTGYLTLAVAAVVLLAAIGIGSTATGTGGAVPDACTSRTRRSHLAVAAALLRPDQRELTAVKRPFGPSGT